MELRNLLAVAWKRRWVVATVLVAAVAAATVFALLKPKTYESTAVLALVPDAEQGQQPLPSDSLTALLGTYAEAAKSEINLRRAQAILGRPLPGTVDSSTEAGTGILRISARAHDADDAAVAAGAATRATQELIEQQSLLRTTLVDPPSRPETPVQPRPPLIIGSAAIAGLICGLLLAAALEATRRRIRVPEDVAEYTPAPVVGSLPRQRSLARGGQRLVWDLTDAEPLKESYRALRTNLEFLLDDSTRCVQVTSPDPEQGKSTVVAGLGAAFAQIGVRTLILDADLRRPSQHEIFGLDNSAGLSSALRYGRPAEVQQTREEGLAACTSGPIAADPTEMLHIRFAAVLAELRERGELILVDSPPILTVSDARLIAPAVDGVLLVVGAGRQKPANLRSALEKLALVDARLLGVILMGADTQAGETSGYYAYARQSTT